MAAVVRFWSCIHRKAAGPDVDPWLLDSRRTEAVRPVRATLAIEIRTLRCAHRPACNLQGIWRREFFQHERSQSLLYAKKIRSPSGTNPVASFL